ncbi:hypothetical protein [Umezawaea sp. Da 62-37]|uniref:hypothetical protein n=1 Tax=Umezawaea sp. Da 62-37 TaxID=3075927 RepID=UPI0028F6F492|nr:hypothetical protein [Umezawaea sp. Da 62-37]WNV88291.1 hypothetical protein RM788_08335 [Umezawaea sp. Da 62-37]
MTGSDGEQLLEVFGQVADMSLDLAIALDQHDHDALWTSTEDKLLRAWTGALPETRAAVLLTTAWGSRDHDLDTADDQSDLDANDLQTCAREHTGDPDGFRLAWGRDFPGMTAFLRETKGEPAPPTHERAGALATRLAADPETSLRTALVLLAPVRLTARDEG